MLVTPNNVVLPVLSGGPGAWTVKTPCERVVQVGAGRFVPGVDVVIDPGHGGGEPGAVAPGGMREKDLNLAVAQRIIPLLEQRGIHAILTRTADYQVTLGGRAVRRARRWPRRVRVGAPQRRARWAVGEAG